MSGSASHKTVWESFHIHIHRSIALFSNSHNPVGQHVDVCHFLFVFFATYATRNIFSWHCCAPHLAMIHSSLQWKRAVWSSSNVCWLWLQWHWKVKEWATKSAMPRSSWYWRKQTLAASHRVYGGALAIETCHLDPRLRKKWPVISTPHFCLKFGRKSHAKDRFGSKLIVDTNLKTLLRPMARWNRWAATWGCACIL